jgi:hypothetical protein
MALSHDTMLNTPAMVHPHSLQLVVGVMVVSNALTVLYD